MQNEPIPLIRNRSIPFWKYCRVIAPPAEDLTHTSCPSRSCLLCSRMLVAQGLNPTTFPPFSRLAANLAGAEGFQLGIFETLANGIICMVHVDTQPTELLFHLQDF